MKAYYCNVSVWLVMMVVVVLTMSNEVQLAMGAVTCDPTQLSPCMGAITSKASPSALCCTRIKQQRPCLCQYLKNPTFKKFINTPNARNVATTCGTPFPKC